MFESHKNMALSAAIMCLMVACVCDIMNKKGIPGICIYNVSHGSTFKYCPSLAKSKQILLHSQELTFKA